MLRMLLLSLLILQIRTPSALRPAASPPPEGAGKFQEYSYTFRREPHYVVLEFTPLLPAKRTVVLEAMKSACQHLYDLDFSKVKPRQGPAPDEWLFQLGDLRTCYARQMPSPEGTRDVKWLRVWMPS